MSSVAEHGLRIFLASAITLRAVVREEIVRGSCCNIVSGIPCHQGNSNIARNLARLQSIEQLVSAQKVKDSIFLKRVFQKSSLFMV